MQHNKLVRDNIPDIIRKNGDVPITRTLTDTEYTLELYKKLDEEVNEYFSDKNIEELADILEVIFALAETHGVSKEDLMKVYKKKHDERGGFERRIFLIEAKNNEEGD